MVESWTSAGRDTKATPSYSSQSPLCIDHVYIRNSNRPPCSTKSGRCHEVWPIGGAKVIHTEVYGGNRSPRSKNHGKIRCGVDQRGNRSAMELTGARSSFQLWAHRHRDRQSAALSIADGAREAEKGDKCGSVQPLLDVFRRQWRVDGHRLSHFFRFTATTQRRPQAVQLHAVARDDRLCWCQSSVLPPAVRPFGDIDKGLHSLVRTTSHPMG